MRNLAIGELKCALLSAFVLMVSLSKTGKSDTSSRIVLPQGPVAGIRIFSGSRTRVTAFLGIPYALPPIGDLRFSAPARHPGWNTTLYAGHFRPDCPQLQQEEEPSSTDEDCLYLNVFVPEMDTTYRNLPTAVFLHGIDYVSGSPLVVAPEELASEGVIVVTVSYRLNVFGFFSFEDDFARGNLGILDQYMALLWVKENIKYLGGSPGNVTLIGHGSGASSALIHMTSPRTKDLFQRVILISGSLFSPWLRSHPKTEARPVLSMSRSIARSLGCYGEKFPQRNSRTSEVILSCLRSKSKDEILRAFQSSYKNGNWSEHLEPLADNFLAPENQYLPTDPLIALKNGKFTKIPILTGITPNEGTLTLHRWKDLITGREEDIRRFAETTAITDILAKYNFTFPEARSLMLWNYFDKYDSKKSVLLRLVKLYNDAMYMAPFIRQLRILSEHAIPVFVYLFAYPTFEYLGNYGQLLDLDEAGHGSELSFLFGPSLFQKVSGRRFTTAEERLSIKMKRLFSSFIRTGNPNPAPYALNVWDQYTSREKNYLKLYIDPGTGENLKKVTGNLDKEADTLWNSLFPSLGNLSSERSREWEKTLVYTGGTSLDVKNGSCNSYKNAMFTILAFLIILLFVLLVSLLLLKKRTKERDRNIL